MKFKGIAFILFLLLFGIFLSVSSCKTTKKEKMFQKQQKHIRIQLPITMDISTQMNCIKQPDGP